MRPWIGDTDRATGVWPTSGCCGGQPTQRNGDAWHRQLLVRGLDRGGNLKPRRHRPRARSPGGPTGLPPRGCALRDGASHEAAQVPPLTTGTSSAVPISRASTALQNWDQSPKPILIMYQAQLATAGRRKLRFRRSRNDVSGGPNVDSRSPESHRGRLRFVSAARLSLVRNQEAD